jgi:hypothetical protein
MARIRSEVKPKKGLVQKLFYPLYIKLPIQAVAAVLIAVTTLYIFKTIQPEMKFVKVPSEEITPQIPSHEKGRATDIEKGKSIPSQRTKALAGKKEAGISLTINVKDIDSASNKIAETIVYFEGKIIKTESFEAKKVFIAELNSKNMKELIERLKLVGEVKEEKIDLEVLEGNIWIKIEVMKF